MIASACRSLVRAVVLLGVVAGPAGAEVLQGDGIGTFVAHHPATATVVLGEDEVRMTLEASASLGRQVKQWEKQLTQKKPFRARFSAHRGVVQSIQIEPRL